MWVKLGLVGATDFSGFSLWIVHANPVGTDVFTIGNGWFVEISSQPGGLVHFSVTPSAGGGGEWAMDVDRATWCQVGDLIGFVFDGDTVNMEHVRGSVKRTILSRLRTDVADDTGVAFPNPFPAGKIAQPYWIALDVMANQGWRIDEVYHGITPTPVPPTFHGRQA